MTRVGVVCAWVRGCVESSSLIFTRLFVPSARLARARAGSSYKLLWRIMSGITAGTGAVYAEIKDDFVAKGLCGKKDGNGRVTGLELSVRDEPSALEKRVFSCLSTKTVYEMPAANRPKITSWVTIPEPPASGSRTVTVPHAGRIGYDTSHLAGL